METLKTISQSPHPGYRRSSFIEKVTLSICSRNLATATVFQINRGSKRHLTHFAERMDKTR